MALVAFKPCRRNPERPALTSLLALRAFSSEVETGSREENASKQKIRASVLIQSEPMRL
jgi:hypothetical protein